jgi:hypothetical protein
VRGQVVEQRPLVAGGEPGDATLREEGAHAFHLVAPHVGGHEARGVDAVAAATALGQHAGTRGIRIGQRRAAPGGEDERPAEKGGGRAPQANASSHHAICPGASATPTAMARMSRPWTSAASPSRSRPRR